VAVQASPEPVPLGQFLLSRRRKGGAARAELTPLILQTAYAAKVLGRELRRAALVGRLGLVGEKNASGDAQKKLDVYANQVILEAFAKTGLVAALVSEELDELRPLTCRPEAPYVLAIDPLDGSSNTDVNGPLGTLFAFYRRGGGPCEDLEAELDRGMEIEAAGYVLYGPSTVLVICLGGEVHGFTLDHDLGELLLSHEHIRCPEEGKTWSANMAYFGEWPKPVQRFVGRLLDPDRPSAGASSLRYSGALVADVHRCLLEGGVYFYPADTAHPEGKLRLLYESAPLAFVAEAAGGAASDGERRILDLRPDRLHRTTPLVIGSRELVALYEEACR
jgi:fructose-1,6-bisphosphatase I